MKTFYFDNVTSDDLTLHPKRFDNEQDGHARVYCIETMATFYKDGLNQAPLTMFRHMQPDRVRWAGIVKAGDTPFSVQTPAHVRDIANTDHPIKEYQQVSDDPVVFEYSSENPDCQYRYQESLVTWKEGEHGSILNLRAEPFPVAFFMHRLPNNNNASCFMYWPCILSGTYEGKPISGMGENSRQFIPDGKEDKDTQEANYQKTTNYACVFLSGVRQDGRREMVYVYGLYGQMTSGYWLEGEGAVTGIAELIGDWEQLPYVDDGTYVCLNFDIKIANKIIHFNGKWGHKGWTETPWNEKHGQSQIIGTWYEGDTPYEHMLWDSFVENMDAFEDNLKAAGYHLKD